MMGMAYLISTELLHLEVLFFLFLCLLFSSSLGQQQRNHLLSCNTTSQDTYGYHCTKNEQCGTFAILRTNSYYSSLFNLSYYLGINRLAFAEANGFSADTEYLPKDQPLLIPIDCRCNDNGGFFRAELTKTTIKGESFYAIAESLEGLTNCKAIIQENPSVPPLNLGDKVRLVVPIRCACPSSSSQSNPEPRFLVSYPVSDGDKVSNLALKFNTTPEAIISLNKRMSGSFRPESLTLLSSLLIPLNGVPILEPMAKPSKPNIHYPSSTSNNITVFHPHKKKKLKMWKNGLYIGLGGIAIGAVIAMAVGLLVIQLKKKGNKEIPIKGSEMELQQLSLSVRTTSDKKVSVEGYQDPLDGKVIDATPKKMILEMYTTEELRKATEDFSSSNQIEGAVYHGRLNGKNMAIKLTRAERMSQIDFGLFHDATHHHPNILRLLGACLTEGPHSYLVFEYAKNGALKDWLHGGLAMKNQFIASCYCFLTWSQRLRICLDVAMGLQYMHHVMIPSYVHRNIKSRSIFLDEEFSAKIGNFGMSNCSENDREDPRFYSNNPASWSLGYLAPEYIHQGVISTSMDIFAFGVVLLEVLSGQTPITRPNEKGEGSVWLSEKIKSLLQSENADELREWMDSALGENYSFDAAVTVANIARACVEEESCLRPSARELVQRLSRLVEELPEGDNLLVCEGSSKPLVKAAAKTSNS